MDAQALSARTAPDDVAPAAVDPLVAERQRRDYESLFASNVVLSRRPDGQHPDQGQLGVPSKTDPRLATGEPSIDEIADAVVRALTSAEAAAAYERSGATPLFE